MEGPSLYLAAEQLEPFAQQTIKSVFGNTKIGKERLQKKKLISVFSYGKYLFFQFDAFALHVHFLLYGSFEATLNGKKITGDYPKKRQKPRLALQFKNGIIELYNCSIHYIEDSNAKASCDFTIDIMSEAWDEKKAILALRANPKREIADLLLDQSIFKGVGNIIKNESLYLAKMLPTHRVADLSDAQIKNLVTIVRAYVFRFYEWRKNFELRQHYQVYRQSFCRQCKNKVQRKKTGLTRRISYVCTFCQH